MELPLSRRRSRKSTLDRAKFARQIHVPFRKGAEPKLIEFNDGTQYIDFGQGVRKIRGATKSDRGANVAETPPNQGALHE